MKIVTIIGARPQFVKASVVSHALRRKGVEEILVNTGQHYDENMARIFFEEMGIPRPDYDLGVGSGSHAAQTSASLIGIEEVLIKEKPDGVIVYGDTNATIAGALAASKLHIKLYHIEAGLRSYNREMPEEINRVVTDVLSDLLFVPTQVAVDNLKQEGLTRGVHVVGDVMVDSLIKYTALAETKSDVLERLSVNSDGYVLMTIHRPSNTDAPERLRAILEQTGRSRLPVIFPVHPRGRQRIDDLMQGSTSNIQLIEPVGYLDMMLLEKHAAFIITDSGGVQKEAYLHKTKCLTVRAETEWVETVRDGWNHLVGERLDAIPELLENFPEPTGWYEHYGNGRSAERIAELILG